MTSRETESLPPEAPPASPAGPGRIGRAARVAAPAALLVLSALFAASHMDTGIDTWISLAGGRDVAAHGVRDADPFSFQSRPPHPAGGSAAARLGHWLQPSGWINQNWLTHLLLYGLLRAFGFDALVVWKIVNYLLAGLVMAATARVLGASRGWAALAAGAALAASRDFLSIRAQDLTNLLLAVLGLLLALAARRDRRFYWALPPLFALWANAHGGYVVGFLVIAVFIASEWYLARQAPGAGEAGSRRFVPLAVAGAVSLVIAAAASPYRLTNLTHPLVISISADAPAWRVVREWKPLFSNPVASPWPFVAFAAAALAAHVVCTRLAAHAGDRFVAAGAHAAFAAFVLAVTSARFVPVACIVAAPFVAVWLEGAATALLARLPPAAPGRRRLLDIAAGGAGAAALVLATAAFAFRAERTYFGPWTQSAERTGLFDRMTYSHQRPWGPCAFLAANGVAGRMWNFWDEGGFLVFCQAADPVAGKVPAEIFIDGRAQAAYDVQALSSYLELLNGTFLALPAGEESEGKGSLAALRSATGKRLSELGVWIALVPASKQKTAFARAVVGIPGWKIVYVDPGHMLFVDTADPRGRALSDRVGAGEARFPDQASQLLTAAFRLLPPSSDADARRAVAAAQAAWRARPCSLAVLGCIRAARTAELREQAARFCLEVAQEFAANRERHRAADGYAERLDAAATALEHLVAQAAAAQQSSLGLWASSWLEIARADQEAVRRRALW